jgi:hypothetical protein
MTFSQTVTKIWPRGRCRPSIAEAQDRDKGRRASLGTGSKLSYSGILLQFPPQFMQDFRAEKSGSALTNDQVAHCGLGRNPSMPCRR